ncbi:MAG: multiheme c-type cytochrome [Sulfurimonas sp.]|jgi:nitrate/TMAO reductase-like tetraheme cytochrome c subunit|nr:multiheme c-type cytochrome [Sulfurimonas sp.]
MRFFLIIVTIVIALSAAKVVEVSEEYQTSQKCKSCHLQIVKDWEESWHSKSHYLKDEYFRATLKYVARKTRKSLNSVKVECATCHNPRISVTSTDLSYEIKVLMKLDKGSKVNKATHNSAISEGINCVVCHNIDKIYEGRDSSHRGMNRVSWTKSGTMVGPFSDAASPYHKTEYRDFMDKKSDQLCFVCHANDKSVKGLVFTDMQSEYKKSDKGCVDCHMGSKVSGVAATLRLNDGKAKKRDIRTHTFPGAHVSDIWRDVLALSIWQKDSDIIVVLKNPQPHNIPSGFGSRELIVDISYKKDNKEIDSKSISLTRHYKRRRAKATIPHLAIEASQDMSIPAFGKKVLKVKNVAGATSVNVKVYYRLVNEEVRSILDLKEAIWSKKSLITFKNLQLK